MPVKTGKGDAGYTDLLGGPRVRKDHQIVELVGEIDELAAWIGMVRSEIPDTALRAILEKIQIHLSMIMAVISSSQSQSLTTFPEIIQNLQTLEDWIAAFEKNTEFPHTFMQAGNSKSGALLNLARAISRRVERSAVTVLHSDDERYSSILAYLNRLSTFFYVLWVQAEQL
jgi:cob(I)alamin adenosyltransferase